MNKTIIDIKNLFLLFSWECISLCL